VRQATLRGLAPGAAYTYRVGSSTDLFSWSPRFTFRSMRERDDGQPLRLLALCDAGVVDPPRDAALNAAVADAAQARRAEHARNETQRRLRADPPPPG
jgi:hypothetical protein